MPGRVPTKRAPLPRFTDEEAGLQEERSGKAKPGRPRLHATRPAQLYAPTPLMLQIQQAMQAMLTEPEPPTARAMLKVAFVALAARYGDLSEQVQPAAAKASRKFFVRLARADDVMDLELHQAAELLCIKAQTLRNALSGDPIYKRRTDGAVAGPMQQYAEFVSKAEQSVKLTRPE